VMSEESDVAAAKISTTSPIGRALLNKRVGDTATVVTPGGSREMEILKLSTMHELAEAALEAHWTRNRSRSGERNERPSCGRYDHGLVDMSWTNGVGRACGVLLDAIVRLLALSHINPNILTVDGVGGEYVRKHFCFGYATATISGGCFLYAGLVIIGRDSSTWWMGGWRGCRTRSRGLEDFSISIVDRYSDASLFSGIAGFFTAGQPLSFMCAGGRLAMISAIMVSLCAGPRGVADLATCRVGLHGTPGAPGAAESSGRCFNVMAPVLWVIAVLSTITVIHRVIYTWQRTREMDAPARAA